MYINNPYAQGGWTNTANSHSINDGGWGSLLPYAPTFGALPSSTAGAPPSILTFHFTNFNPDLLNCTIIGPQNRVYYKVTPGPPGSTYVQKPDNSSILYIEWHQSPVVEVREIIPRQPVKQWFSYATDGKSRILEVKGRRYSWVFQDTFAGLYSVYPGPAEMHARFYRSGSSIILEVTTQGIHLSLLEVSIASVILFNCDKNLD